VNGGYKEIVRNGFNTDYLPIWLQNHGYDTYYTGKLYNGMDEHLVKENPVQGWTKAVRRARHVSQLSS
jgi:N-acetylglucosamine-6-sulfatase